MLQRPNLTSHIVTLPIELAVHICRQQNVETHSKRAAALSRVTIKVTRTT